MTSMDRKCKSLVNYTTESSDDEDCNEEMHAAKLKLKDWAKNDSDMDSNFETMVLMIMIHLILMLKVPMRKKGQNKMPFQTEQSMKTLKERN